MSSLIRTCNSSYSSELNCWPDRHWPEKKNKENILLLGAECYCYTACPAAPVFLVVFSNLCRVSLTSWMETICLTDEPLEVVQRMSFTLSLSGILLWTDHLFWSYAASAEGPFHDAYKESLCVPHVFSSVFFWLSLFSNGVFSCVFGKYF